MLPPSIRSKLEKSLLVASLAGALQAGCVAIVEGRPERERARPPGSSPPGVLGGGDAGAAAATASAEQPVEGLHRLNRFEYDNTVRDLLATAQHPASVFPVDAQVGDFDNVATGLSLSPALFSLYADAARALASEAVAQAPRYSQSYDPAQAGLSFGYPYGEGAWAMADGIVTPAFTLPESEPVIVRIRAAGIGQESPLPIMSVRVDADAARTWTVDAPPAQPADYEIALELGAGPHTLTIATENYYSQPAENKLTELVLGTVTVTSEATTSAPGRALVYTCDPTAEPDSEACYREIVVGFAERAYRRPLAPPSADRVFELWKSLATSEGPDTAVELVLRALLLSPKFLYRAPLRSAAEALDTYSLASRLSYFLWSSMPDSELFGAAKSGELETDAGLEAAALRLLTSDKAAALRESFAAQWLDVRALETRVPDAELFPDFDDELRAAMVGETKALFDAVLQDDLPVERLLTPGFGFVNDRLARHYGLPEPGSGELVRVTLNAGERAGILAQGAWLTATSEPTRTSPVRRGRFVLEKILCRNVPPPPADVPPFEEVATAATVRERLEQHRKSAACAGCHNLLDPPGLGLEEFDAVGVRRTTELGAAIDSSGGIPADADSFSADQSFSGAAELAQILAADTRFRACLTRKLFGYALGRSVSESGDAQALAALDQEIAASAGTLPELVRRIVLSAAFRSEPGSESP